MSKMISSARSARKPFQRRAGFTLVELTIAIGVMSFALLTVVGLNSAGLNTLQEARSSMLLAQVVQAVEGEARLSMFNNLATLAGIRFYDQEGRQVDAPASAFAVVISEPLAVNANAKPLPTDDIQRLTLDIYQSPGGKFVSGNDSPSYLRSRSVLVANSERDAEVGATSDSL